MKPTKTIRLSGNEREVLGRTFVRLTLNPVLLGLSGPFVQWEGPAQGRKLSPAELVLRAKGTFPDLPLSWAVEGYLVTLLAKRAGTAIFQSSDAAGNIPEEDWARIVRFRKQTPIQKIHYGENQKRTLRRFRGLH